MIKTEFMSENRNLLMFSKVLKLEERLVFSLTTLPLMIKPESFTTPWKALAIGYKSLENKHIQNLTLKNLNLVDSGRKSFFNLFPPII